MSDPIIELPNPNDAEGRAPGDPTISLDPDGTMANEPSIFVATSPTNPTPTPQSDPAHVPSPYQPEEDLEVLKENARLREVALQAENRLRIDRTPNAEVDLTPHVDPVPEPVAAAEPVWDPDRQIWR
jgi:hypothetical protein